MTDEADAEQVDALPSIGRVLLVGTFVSDSMANTNVGEELAEHLRAHGWEVFTTSDSLYRVPRLIDMVRTAWHTRHQYDVAQVDVFSGKAFIWAEAVCWTLRRARKPYILTLHGGNLPRFAQRWPGRVRRLLQSAAVVTAPSAYLREQMRTYRDEIELVPNPINIDDYSFRWRKRATPRLVWLRTFCELYNPMLAPRVVALLAERIPEVRLAMIGPDREDGSLEKTEAIAAELGVLNRIDFVGPVPKVDVPDHLSDGDIFINTTNYDNTPVSVIEAMACGLCVVSTDVGGIPYMLSDERDALLVPPDNPRAMAQAVARLVQTPHLVASISLEARRHAETLDWSSILPRWLSLFNRARSDG